MEKRRNGITKKKKSDWRKAQNVEVKKGTEIISSKNTQKLPNKLFFFSKYQPSPLVHPRFNSTNGKSTDNKCFSLFFEKKTKTRKRIFACDMGAFLDVGSFELFSQPNSLLCYSLSLSFWKHSCTPACEISMLGSQQKSHESIKYSPECQSKFRSKARKIILNSRLQISSVRVREWPWWRQQLAENCRDSI